LDQGDERKRTRETRKAKKGKGRAITKKDPLSSTNKGFAEYKEEKIKGTTFLQKVGKLRKKYPTKETRTGRKKGEGASKKG